MNAEINYSDIGELWPKKCLFNLSLLLINFLCLFSHPGSREIDYQLAKQKLHANLGISLNTRRMLKFPDVHISALGLLTLSLMTCFILFQVS